MSGWGYSSSSAPDGSSSTSSDPQILTRTVIPSLLADLDASDVIECYALTRHAPLHFLFPESDSRMTESGSIGTTVISGNDTSPTQQQQQQKDAGNIMVQKNAIGLRYSPPANSNKPKMELSLEYGPQRMGSHQKEAMPLVHISELDSFVTWENEGKIYYTTNLEKGSGDQQGQHPWSSAYYMASVSGTVLQQLLYWALDYPTAHPRYQPFQVWDPVQNKIWLKSSGSHDFLLNIWQNMADVGVELHPVLPPPEYAVRLLVNNITKVSGVMENDKIVAHEAAGFFQKFYDCVTAIATGNYQKFQPSATPTASPVPTISPTTTTTTTEKTSLSPTPTPNPSELQPTNATDSSGDEIIDDDDDGSNSESETNNEVSDEENTDGNVEDNDAETLNDTDDETDADADADADADSENNAADDYDETESTELEETNDDNDDNSNRRIFSFGNRDIADEDFEIVSEIQAPSEETQYDDEDESGDDDTDDATEEPLSTASPTNSMAPSISPKPSAVEIIDDSDDDDDSTGGEAAAAMQAADEAKEAAAQAKDAAHTDAENKAATAAEAAANAAQKAADATSNAAAKAAIDKLMSGDGELVTSVLRQCFDNPQYGISVVDENNTSVNSYAYLYLDGSNYYQLNLAPPYIDVVIVDHPLPQIRPAVASEGGDMIDWLLAILVIGLCVFGVLATLQQIGFSILFPNLQQWFFSPTHGNYEDARKHDDELHKNRTGEGFVHNFAEDAIPLSMGGRRATGKNTLTSGRRRESPGLHSKREGSNEMGDLELAPIPTPHNSLRQQDSGIGGISLLESTSSAGSDQTGKDGNFIVDVMEKLDRMKDGLEEDPVQESDGRPPLPHRSSSASSGMINTKIPLRLAKDPSLVDLPNLKSSSKVATPVGSVGGNERRSRSSSGSSNGDSTFFTVV